MLGFSKLLGHITSSRLRRTPTYYYEIFKSWRKRRVKMYTNGHSRLLDYYLTIMKRKESETLDCTNSFELMRLSEKDAMHVMENVDSDCIESQIDVVSTRNFLEVQRAFGSAPSNVYKEPGGILIERLLLAFETNCIGNVQNTQDYCAVSQDHKIRIAVCRPSLFEEVRQFYLQLET